MRSMFPLCCYSHRSSCGQQRAACRRMEGKRRSITPHYRCSFSYYRVLAILPSPSSFSMGMDKRLVTPTPRCAHTTHALPTPHTLPARPTTSATALLLPPSLACHPSARACVGLVYAVWHGVDGCAATPAVRFFAPFTSAATSSALRCSLPLHGAGRGHLPLHCAVCATTTGDMLFAAFSCRTPSPSARTAPSLLRLYASCTLFLYYRDGAGGRTVCFMCGFCSRSARERRRRHYLQNTVGGLPTQLRLCSPFFCMRAVGARCGELDNAALQRTHASCAPHTRLPDW